MVKSLHPLMIFTLAFSCLSANTREEWIHAVDQIIVLENQNGEIPPSLTQEEQGELENRLNHRYRGVSFSKSDSEELKQEISQFYNSKHLLTDSVLIPPQDVTDGKLVTVVQLSRLGSVTLSGNEHFSDHLLKKYFRTEEGEPIHLDRIAADLSWMNRNPFRRTGAIFSPGEGSVNVELITQDRRPFYVYYGWDDRGNNSIGNFRQFAGFTWGKFFGLDHTLSYQFTNSAFNSHLLAHVVNYEFPLPWRHYVSIYGGYSHVRSKEFARSFRNEGKSAQGSLRYTLPIVRSSQSINQIIVGADYKFTDNNLQFSEIPLFSKNTALFQLSLAWTWENQRTDGIAKARIEITSSPFKKWFPHQNEADYETLRPFSEVQYIYGQAEFEKTWSLPRSFCFRLRTLGQAASTNLLPSEQFGLGGMSTIRGYEERIFNADLALLGNIELSFPPLSFFDRLCSTCTGCTPCSIIPTPPTPKVMDRFTFYLFADYGLGMVYKKIPESAKSENLLGVGPGLKYSMDPYMNLQVDWGFRLLEVQLEESIGGRLHFQWIGRF